MTSPTPGAPDPIPVRTLTDDGNDENEREENRAPDVRSGGHAGDAPRSLTEAEAHWQEHESSGASWDSRESI